MLTWQLVHGSLRVVWMCSGTADTAVAEFGDGRWQRRQMVFTLASMSSPGFDPPCGK